MSWNSDKWRDLPFHGDDNEWNQETGQIGILRFADAIATWSIFQNRERVTVAEAAVAFNCTPRMVREACNGNCWMTVSGPDDDFTKQIIEHEGE